MSLATLKGMSRSTGRMISGIDYVRQCVSDLLTTPIGTRVCNRDYGSNLPDLVDAPMNAATIQRIYAATAMAISRFLPIVTIIRLSIDLGTPSAPVLTIELTDAEAPAAPSFNVTIPANLLSARKDFS
jgi:uncharacterized protein